MFKTENRLLFVALSCAKDKERMLNLLKEQKNSGEVDEESVKAILRILGVREDLEAIKKTDENGNAIEDLRRDERKEGKREGIKTGRRERNLTMVIKSVKNLMKNQKVTCEEDMKILEIPKKMHKKIEALV